MSASPDDVMAENQPESSRSSLSGASNGAQQQSNTNTDSRADRPSASVEKTISCVSCRRRKLKCDRVKPKCGTCSRLRHECEYPERRRNQGSKRRNMKELEARLAQVETQLVAETAKGVATAQVFPVQNTETDWNTFSMDMNVDMGNIDMLDESFNVPISGFDYHPAPNALPEGDFFSQELVGLGLSEPLPPREMIDELNDIYFDKFHPTMPMIHKYRYLAALNLPHHMQPPVCLQYAVWATAASVSEKYLQYEAVLYDRARKYIQEAEMKGHGESFVTIQYAQAWGLISTFEAKKTYFTRAWMSTGRMTRLAQMLGLQRLDGEGQDIKRILPPPKDWVEQEERRRVFWAAFYGDRWASSGTGWPMVIEEHEIRTNLPSSEEAFYSGVPEETTSLHEALTPEGASKISPFGGVVLSACLFGHNFQHLHKTGPDERPDDLANGEFWKRHRRMDNVLSNTFMYLPDHLRLPGGIRDMNVVFLHMNIHASTICLHQAAVLTAEKNDIAQFFIRQSRTRCLMAAEEIANTMRLVSHLDASNLNSWMGFCLYVAAGVFIQDYRVNNSHSSSLNNLEFILAAMKAIGNRHSITHHFTAQLEIDIDSSGINAFSPADKLPNVALNGILPVRASNPTSMDDLQSIWQSTNTDKSGLCSLVDDHPYIAPRVNGHIIANNVSGPEAPASGRVNPPHSRHFFGIIPRENETNETTRTMWNIWQTHDNRGSVLGPALNMIHAPVPTPQSSVEGDSVAHLPPEGLRKKHVHPSFPNWDPPANSALSDSNSNRETRAPHQQQNGAVPSPPAPKASRRGNSAGSPFDIDSYLATNTPSSDSSSSSTMRFPFRQAEPNNGNLSDNASFQTDQNGFNTSADRSTEMYSMETVNIPDGRHSHPSALPQPTDAVREFFRGDWSEGNPSLGG